jgi:hypothetical protein
MNEVLETIEPNYILKQGKEKFGGLRYVCSVPDLSDDDRELFYSVKSHYEKLSLRTCEVCGQDGSPTKTSWIRTRCEDHLSATIEAYE